MPTTAHPTTEAIWTEFHQELHRFLLRHVRNDEVAQDLPQDIFIKIHLRHPLHQLLKPFLVL